MAKDTNDEAWQRYFEPGTEVLANRRGIRDAAELEQYERAMTSRRLAELPRTPHTPEGYKQIHRHLFQDLYEWAGRPRTVNMMRTETLPDGTVRRDDFIPPRFVEQGLATAFAELQPALPQLRREAKRPPEERDAEVVARAAAGLVSSLNFAHAFRDGNGRTMRAQVDNLAQEAGLRLNERALDMAAWNRGSHEANDDPKNTLTLARIIAAALEPRERTAEREKYVARGERPPHVGRHARDAPGRRDERDYEIAD